MAFPTSGVELSAFVSRLSAVLPQFGSCTRRLVSVAGTSLFALAACAAALAILPARVQAAPDRIVSLPHDNVLVPDDDTVTGIVLVISDANGWDLMEQTALDAVALEGAIGVGVDLRTWRAALSREIERDCLYLPADIELLAHQLHSRHALVLYHPPRVIGFGEGATLALAIAAQTPNTGFGETIGETLAVDPTGAVALPKSLCTAAEHEETSLGSRYGLAPGRLPNPIRIVFSPAAGPAGRAYALALQSGHSDVVITDGKGGPARVLAVETKALALRLTAEPAGEVSIAP